jgi:hypothetical protein
LFSVVFPGLPERRDGHTTSGLADGIDGDGSLVLVVD